MAVNYAEKYSSVIDEQFHNGSLTELAINQDYFFDDFSGVNKVNLYSTSTVPLVNYNMEAQTNRYGSPIELGNEVETFTLSQDKSFTFTLDKRNYEDSAFSNSAGAALNREINEVIIPAIDEYRISVMAAKAGTVLEQAISENNAYSSFLDASVELVDKKIPINERIAFVSPAYYRLIKLDKSFVSTGDKAHELAQNGVVGFLDGAAIIVIPTSYFPKGTNYIISHPMAMTAPVKLADYKIHEMPQGINGWLVEGRIYYDAFIPKNKKNAILISKVPTA